MITSIASVGTFGPGAATLAAAAPTHPAANLHQPAQTRAAQPAICAVALAPAAMTALLDAQARLHQDPTPLARADTVATLDRLIASLAGAPAAQAAQDDVASSPVRQLEQTREAMARTPVDLQA